VYLAIAIFLDFWVPDAVHLKILKFDQHQLVNMKITGFRAGVKRQLF
jgi:hypothetical protein